MSTVVQTGDPEVDAGLKIASTVVSMIPAGPFQSEMKQLLSGDILGAIGKMIKGYTYTGGDYALGEIFLNRVMGKQTTSRWDTPDAVVPVAWVYFTSLLGIPVCVNTDLDNIETGSLEGYLSGRPEQRDHVTQAQVTRAKQVIDILGHNDKMTPWPPSSYGVIPYVAPIPDPRTPGSLFNGTLPNGQLVKNGLPVSGSGATVGSGVQGLGGGSSSIIIYVAIAIAIIILFIIIIRKK